MVYSHDLATTIIFSTQVQIQHLNEEACRKSEEMKTMQKILEENDAKMKRLAQLVRAQEGQLQWQQKLDPRTMDEHQLQKYLDILSDIMDLKKKLSDAEDERHITATKVKVLQEEAVTRQQHATALVSGSRNGTSFLSLSFPLPPLPCPLLHPMPSCSPLTPLLPPQPPLSFPSHHSLSNTNYFISITVEHLLTDLPKCGQLCIVL